MHCSKLCQQTYGPLPVEAFMHVIFDPMDMCMDGGYMVDPLHLFRDYAHATHSKWSSGENKSLGTGNVAFCALVALSA